MSRIKCGGLKNDPIGTTPVIMPKNADASLLSLPMAVNSNVALLGTSEECDRIWRETITTHVRGLVASI